MSINSFGIENVTHQCQDCGMKFYNSHELVNHMKKFCTASGLNSLEGLAHYQNTSAFSKKLKNYGANSLGTMKYQPNYDPSQLAKQARDLQRHRQQLAANRHYSNTDMNNNKPLNEQYQKKNQTQFGLYQRSNVKKVKIPQHTNSRAAYGQKILGSSDISIHSLNNFGQGNNATNNQKGTYKSLLLSNADQQYHSPPSALPSKPFGKKYGPSVLQKSNSSIANMTMSQKKQYASDKLVQLDNIAELYDKSGGMSMDFRKNLQKMKKFYKNMLQDDKPLKQYPGQFAQSRVQTPINKLRNIQGNENFASQKKPNIAKDSLDKQLVNKSKARKNEYQNNQKLYQSQKSRENENNKNQSYLPFNNNNSYQNSYPPQMFNPYPQPQIIMIPPYPQQNNQQKQNINEQIKYLQNLLQMKNEQNKKLMKMVMDTKRQKNKQVVKSKVQEMKRSRISSMGLGSLYHMQSPMQDMPSTQEKILLALQRQELDQLRLLSTLPEQLQKLKMQSVMKIIQQRTQLQKQILQQRVRRLQQQKRNQLHQQKVRLDKDQWANEERKKLIGHQMDDIIEQFKKKVNGQDSEQQDVQDQDDENVQYSPQQQ